MDPLNVIVCGEAIAEVDALIAAMCSRQSVAIPEGSLLKALAAAESLEDMVPGVVIGETYGRPPRVTVPSSRLLAYNGGASILSMLSHGSAEGPGGDPELFLYHAKDPSLLLATSIKPHVLIVCFVPSIVATFDRVKQSWLNAIDRMYPRPPVLLCGSRSESLGDRTFLTAMRDAGAVAVDANDICDAVLRGRCLTYVELSAMYYVNVDALYESVIKACVGEPEKRINAAAVLSMRHLCVQAAVQRQAIWSARRNPKNNRLFYYNRVTKKSQYTRPAEYDGEEPELTREERLEEEQRKLEQDELRLQQEREETDIHAYRQELEEYEQRMTDKMSRRSAMQAEVNRFQSQLDTLRERQQSNINERQALERKKEEMGLEELHFSKSTVDYDRLMDAKVQIAKSKLFELDAVAQLKAEELFATEISEALVVNRGLASKIRDILREQMQIQQQGSEAQTAFDVTSRRLDEAAVTIAECEPKIQKAEAERESLRASVRELVGVMQTLRRSLAELHAAESHEAEAPLRRQKDIRAAEALLAELDEEVRRRSEALEQELRGDPDGDPRERQRLALYRETTVRSLAEEAAALAALEVQLKRIKLQLQFASDEFSSVADTLLDMFRERARVARAHQEHLRDTAAYSPIAAAGLQAVAIEVDARLSQPDRDGDTRAPRSSTAQASSLAAATSSTSPGKLKFRARDQQMSDVFHEKLAAAAEADRLAQLAQVAADQYATATLSVRHQKLELDESLAMVDEALTHFDDGNSTLKGKTPIARFVSILFGATQGCSDRDRLVKLGEACFRESVLRKVVTPALESSSGAALAARLRRLHTVGSISSSGGGGGSEASETLRETQQRLRSEKHLLRQSREEYDSLAKSVTQQFSGAVAKYRTV